MRISLIITTFNRPLYLSQCLDSLRRADLSKIESIMIVDDCSTDHETINLIDAFKKEFDNVIVYPKLENKSIKDSLLIGFDYFFERGFSICINLDGDALIRNDAVDKIMAVKNKYPDMIVTGFCCDTLNRDGSIRHEHLYKEEGIVFRRSVGGINMCINREQYHKWVKPSLIKSIQQRLNWDHQTCIKSMEESIPVACVNPSVVQHIGLSSSMGHDAGGEPADTADTFKLLSLPDVTLISIDDNVNAIIKAADISCRDIEFASVKLLSCMPSSDSRVIQIEKLGSKEAYSRFIFDKVVDYIDTPYFIVIQADGYILNAAAFNKDWYNYSYIGAPWFWYEDEYKVGNGGVSWRKRSLHKILRGDENITLCNDHIINDYAEDHNICRIHRSYLEEKHGVKFALVEVAEKFSIEAYGEPVEKAVYNGQFGFHGRNVIFQAKDLHLLK